MNSAADIWERVLSLMEQTMTKTTISTWFSDAEPVALEENRFILYIPTDFKKEIVVSRYLPDIKAKNFNRRSFAERTAINTPIQGTAADIIKIAMLKVAKKLKEAGVKSRVLLQVHDELVLEVPKEEKDQVAEIVKTTMEQAVPLEVPLVADVATGENWAKAK